MFIFVGNISEKGNYRKGQIWYQERNLRVYFVKNINHHHQLRLIEQTMYRTPCYALRTCIAMVQTIMLEGFIISFEHRGSTMSINK